MNIKESIAFQKEMLKNRIDKSELAYGEFFFNNGQCQVLSQSTVCYELLLSSEVQNKVTEYSITIDENGVITPSVGGKSSEWDRNSYACLLQIERELNLLEPIGHQGHKKYTREGMRKRVLGERRQKSELAKYHIQWADNIYGDHILTNENGTRYKIFLRDFDNETGYSNSPDSRYNKLGTTKHIMYAFRILKEDRTLFKKLGKKFPFIEVFCDPLNEYRISWYFPHEAPVDDYLLISKYFRGKLVLTKMK